MVVAPAIDMVGRRFGFWLVIERAGSNKGFALWRCRCCNCGTVRPVAGSRLRRGCSRSCGCKRIAIREGAQAPRRPVTFVQTVWISKHDAIGMMLGRRQTLRGLVSSGKVRTKLGDVPRGCKYPSTLYRRADIERWLGRQAPPQRPWLPSEDALLGTDFDRVVARKLRRIYDHVYQRRRALGIPPHQSGGARCNPASWHWPAGDPRLEPPVSPHG